MKKIILLLLAFLSNYSYGQTEDKSYEQIAFTYFEEVILPKEWKEVKKIEFDGIVDLSSNGFSSCMSPQGIDTLKTLTTKINISKKEIIKKKLSFFDTLLISKSKRKTVYIYKSYLLSNNVIVCLSVMGYNEYRYYTFKINPKTKKVEDYCFADMIQ